MPVNTKAIKRRIKSVGNTKKITKAMEMVSAAKMRRATEAALSTRHYATMAWDLLVKLSISQKQKLPLLKMRPVKRMLVILITSNRGLCGSFNSNIIRKTSHVLSDVKNIAKHRLPGGAEILPESDNVEIDVIAVGKKGINYCKKMGYNVIAAYTDISESPKLENIMPLSKTVIDDYVSQKYDKVVVAYTDFRSSLVQEAKLRQVLPVSQTDLEKMISGLGAQDNVQNTETEEGIMVDDYVFEPNKTQVLNVILPRLVETQVFQALLESSASEHSARMMAMRNASDAADEMIDSLTLTFNKARQAGITQEISEIVGGAAALE